MNWHKTWHAEKCLKKPSVKPSSNGIQRSLAEVTVVSLAQHRLARQREAASIYDAKVPDGITVAHA